jgi:hypothetical protein
MKILYVYYKVPAAQHARLLPLVDRLRAALQAEWPALQVQVLQRPQPSAEDVETWMEVYTHPDGVGDEIAASIARHAADVGLPAQRATEVFVPLRR